MKLLIRFSVLFLIGYFGYGLFLAIGAGPTTSALSGMGLAIAFVVFLPAEWHTQKRRND